MSQIMENKTPLGLKMETLQKAINYIVIHYCDKTEEFQEVHELLQGISEKDKIEEYFIEKSDFEYFIGNFTKELIDNIFTMNVSYSKPAEEIVLKIFQDYIYLFVKHLKNPSYTPLWTSIAKIFELPGSSFYSIGTKDRLYNGLSNEDYCSKYLTKKTILKVEPEQEIDILIKSSERYPYRTWVPGIVCNTFDDGFSVRIAFDQAPLILKYDSFDYCEKGTMRNNWEWRENLKVGDIIDVFERQKYYPGTIIKKDEQVFRGLKNIQYTISFRVYLNSVTGYEKYNVFWPCNTWVTDENGKVYLGDSHSYNEDIPMYSRRLFPRDTKIWNKEHEAEWDTNLYYIDDLIEPIDKEGNKIYVLPREGMSRNNYLRLINYFGRINGFDKILECIGNENGEVKTLSPELYPLFFSILGESAHLLYRPIAEEIAKKVEKNAFKYLLSADNSEFRNMKKNIFVNMISVLKEYLPIIYKSKSKIEDVLGQFGLSFAVRMLKTTYLDKRTTAIKTITDYINGIRRNKEKEEKIISVLEENKVIYEIFGPNSHLQLITRCKELLEIMFEYDKITQDDLTLIWNATKKGDLEAKLAILKIFKEISETLKPQYAHLLLKDMLSDLSSDLINEEIELICEMCLVQDDDELTEKCINYLIEYIIQEGIDEGPKVKKITNKIHYITTRKTKFKTIVLKKALGFVENITNSCVGFKILSIFLVENYLSDDYDLYKLFIEDQKLFKAYKESFIKYMELIRAKVKENKDIINVEKLTLNDKFTHSQNLMCRFEFINILMLSKLWDLNECHPIDFVYDLVLKDKVCDNDEVLFFNFLKNIHSRNELDKKIFDFFVEKFCANKDSIINLSVEGFETFFELFINFASENDEINIKPDKSVDCFVEPEKLAGFETLWKIVFESKSSNIIDKGITFLNALFANVYIDKKNVDYSQKLISRCISQIKNIPQNDPAISKSMKMLSKIIEQSEKHGTANIISHNALLRRNEITIKVESSISTFNKSNKHFEFKVYSNATIYDIKKRISNEISYHHDFLKIEYKKGSPPISVEITSELNGKTLFEMQFASVVEINVSPNGIEKDLPYKEICKNDTPTDEVMKIFNEWFDMFSENNKMNAENCAVMVKAVTGSRENVSVEDSRVVELFTQRDSNHDGFIEREEFVNFYVEATINKPKLVFENLHAMNIRNDLKKMSEPLYEENTNANSMPRFILGNKCEYFDTLFALIQDENDNNVNDHIYDFICSLANNESFVKEDDVENAKWENVFNSHNLYKMVYSMDIIESIVEKINYCELSEVDKCEQFIVNFVNKGGYKYLIDIFIAKLAEMNKNMNAMKKINLMLFINLIKIGKIFYISANEAKTNEKLNDVITKNKLASIIFESFISENLIFSLLTVLDNCKNQNESEIINEIFELVSILIPNLAFEEKYEKIFFDAINFGLLNLNANIRIRFSNALQRMFQILVDKSKFELLEKIFDIVYANIQKMENEKNATELFDIFAYLLNVYIEHKEKFTKANFDDKQYIQNIALELNSELIHNDTFSKLSDVRFIGYLKILSMISANNIEIKNFISNETDLIREIMSEILFKQDSNLLETRYKDVDFIDIDSRTKTANTRNTNEKLRGASYEFILSLLKNSLSDFEKFFSMNLFPSTDKESNKENNSERKDRRTSNERKCEGHVGLKNLGCICYMNSMMQQFFMIPSLRYTILRFSDNVEPNINPTNDVDDNMFHQLQRMFSYLELSERVDFIPFGFTYSFKDFEGNPTKLSEQKDAQEFLSFFLDKLENAIKPSMYKYMTQNIFGGKNCSQITCTSCGKVKNKYEDSLFLSCEVKNMKTLNDSLDKLTSEEKIDGYKCEGCNQNVTITKRNVIASLPNVLIVHLQRICYNFEEDRNEKINSRLEFPRHLNMKQYTLEEKTLKENVTENDEIYLKCDDYYDYYLVGVIVHLGSADSGHYYSYINTIRDGHGNISLYDPNNEKMSKSWLEFNDSNISKFNVEKLEEECYGGSQSNGNERGMMFGWGRNERCKNAYMLVYERKIKRPMKVTLTEEEVKANDKAVVVSYKMEEHDRIMKQYDITRYYGKDEYEDKCDELYKIVFYDEEKKEYYKYIPFYYKNRKVPKNYYIEIEKDNSELEKFKNISDPQFTSFFNEMITLLQEAIMSSSETIDEDSSKRIMHNFLTFIFSMLIKKDKIEFLPSALDKLLQIANSLPLFETQIWRYMNSAKSPLQSLLLNSEIKVVSSISKLIITLTQNLFNAQKENFTEVLIRKPNSSLAEIENKSIKHCSGVLEKICELFPKIPTTSVTRLSPVIDIFRDLCDFNKAFLIFFGNREFIANFITFFLGRDSPCYATYFTKQSDYFDYFTFSSFINVKDIANIIYQIYENNNNITNNVDDIALSLNDVKCITSPHFLRFLFKRGESFLSKFLVVLSRNNKKFTKISCCEIISGMEDCNILYQKGDFIQIIQSIIPLLEIKDEYQLNRFEYLIGIPNLLISYKYTYTFPLIGYHIMKNENDKYLVFKTLDMNKALSSIMNVIYNLKVVKYALEFANILFDACKTNDALFAYLYALPYQSPEYENIFDWAIETMKENSEDYSSNDIKKISDLIESKANTNFTFDNFNGFGNKYLIHDIKRITYELIFTQLKGKNNGIYVFFCDYCANIINLPDKNSRTNIDYSKSKSKSIFMFANTSSNDDDEGLNIVEEENTVLNEENTKDTLLIQSDPKDANMIPERKILNVFLSGDNANIKKVIVENKYSIPNAKSVFRNILIHNTTEDNMKISIRLKRNSHVEGKVNEYMQKSSITIVVSAHAKSEVFSIVKIDPEKDWTMNTNDVEIIVGQ